MVWGREPSPRPLSERSKGVSGVERKKRSIEKTVVLETHPKLFKKVWAFGY